MYYQHVIGGPEFMTRFQSYLILGGLMKVIPDVYGHRLALAALMTGLLVAVGGCNSNGLRVVKGRLVNNGEPLKVSDQGVVQIAFEYATNPDGSFVADVKPDGTFAIEGPTGEGIRPDTYRISVVQLDPYSKRKDLLNGKFSSKSIPITMAIDGKSELLIDLAQYNGGARSSGPEARIFFEKNLSLQPAD
jgi:hypothetical protein